MTLTVGLVLIVVALLGYWDLVQHGDDPADWM